MPVSKSALSLIETLAVCSQRASSLDGTKRGPRLDANSWLLARANWITLLGLFTVLVFQCGCATIPTLQTPPRQPPSAEIRASLGRIGIVALTNSSEIAWQIPSAKGELALLITPSETFGDNGVGIGCCLEGEAGLYALGAVVALALGTATADVALGTLYAAFAAESKERIAQVATALSKAGEGGRLEERLRDRIVDAAQQNARGQLVPLREPTLFQRPLSNGRAVDLDYRAFAVQGIDTIIEVKATSAAFVGPKNINPALALKVRVRVRLVRTKDGGEAYLDYLSYAGSPRRFVEWGSDDARPYRDELQRCVDNLAHEIVTQIFVRQELTKENVVELRGNGIVR